MNTSIYLDYAAATPLAAEAQAAMVPYFNERFYNPSAAYLGAQQVRRELETARHRVAQVIGAKTQEIIFTAGGTEANNLAIHGVMQQYPEANIVTTSIEHDSILVPAGQYTRRLVMVDTAGRVSPVALAQAIDEQTVLVSIIYANNEIGTVQQLKALAEVVRAERLRRKKVGNSLPIWLHTDACQAANYLDLQVTRLGVDLMTLNGGKIYATKQSGCLYVRSGITLRPQVTGGGQEESRRSGTENIAAIQAFATMLQKVQSERKSESRRLEQLRATLFATLSQNIKDLQLNGDTTRRLVNNLNITIPGVDGERLVMELDEAGVQVATGSACSASSDEPSHVLQAIGLSEAVASASLRLTLGRFTTEEEIERAGKLIGQVVSAHRKLV